MEHVSIEEVKYIAKLAKLKVTDEEALKMGGEFEAILGHFKAIDNVELNDVDVNAVDEVNTEFRKDNPEVFEDKVKLMQNVKSLRDTAIEVPKIIE